MKSQYAIGIVTLSLCFGTVLQAQYYNYPPPPAGAYPPPAPGPYPPPPAGMYPPPDAGMYFRLGVGPSFFEDGRLTQYGGPVSSPVKYRTGFDFDAAIGYNFSKYIGADFEFGTISTEIESVPGYLSANSYVYNVPFLANLRLSYPIPHTIVTPYIGAGAGGADVGFDTDVFGPNTSNYVAGYENDVVFAWQAFAGVRFQLNRQMTLGIGYKYFTTEDPTFVYPPDAFAVSFRGTQSHSVLFTFEWKFW